MITNTEIHSSTKHRNLKYPFISSFVDAMEIINAAEYVASSETDLKSLLVFFKLYVQVCRQLKKQGFELTNENIKTTMDCEFELLQKTGEIAVFLMDNTTDNTANNNVIKQIL